MRQNQFGNSFIASLSILALIFLGTSCEKKATDLVNISNVKDLASASSGKVGGTTTVQEVRLKLTVTDAGNQVTSDGGTAYVDGIQNTSIYFSTAGNLQLSTSASNNPNTPTVRWLNVNFGSPLFGSPLRGIEKSNFISTLTGTGPNTTAIQNLTPGQTKCITLSAGFMTIAGGVLNFHNRTEDILTSPTSYVYVTRMDPDINGHAQWLMTAAPPLSFTGCSNISNVAALRINGALYGDYNMPFSFTLTAK